MLSSIKNSLIIQIKYLFAFSFLVIFSLWLFFYIQQKNKYQEERIVRYIGIVNSIQPLLMQPYDLSNADIKEFNIKFTDETYFTNKKILFKKGNAFRGFEVFSTQNKTILHVYNQITDVYFEDLQKEGGIIYIIHIVFITLIFIQLFLYTILNRSLKPLKTLDIKLKSLQSGDMSKLNYTSNYDEINQIISSYNNSISEIEYILETREMFNKIFMHEIKMPIAKVMFYLKQEPCADINEKITQLMQIINKELDEFSILESLIVYKNNIQPQQHNLSNLLNIAIQNLQIEEQKNIKTYIDKECAISGDKELWVICFKNILNNALKYSTNNSVTVKCDKKAIYFINKGEPLPVDLTKNIKNWKIDKTKRHKSSTGYGFGLFIIKNIVNLNKHHLEYLYSKNNVILKIIK